jgi:mono/diheme cytochrome c family protein
LEKDFMKRVLIIPGAVVVCILLVGWLAFSNFSLAAVAEPGGTETYMATKAKHLLIARAVREGVPPRPVDRAASAAQGDNNFAIRCSLCHGEDGHSRTPFGQGMYPRATDLSSNEVQSYSDQELFWIVKNGIRLSGMPAFGKTETDEHIWNMVDHLRTLPVTKN